MILITWPVNGKTQAEFRKVLFQTGVMIFVSLKNLKTI